MKILITSGGTTEAIDRVRGITNHSTGHLGKLIAEAFLAAGDQVTLVTTKAAVKPAPHPQLKLALIEDVADLLVTLEPLVKTHDVLIHSMAVSDYKPVYMTSLEAVEAADDLRQLLTLKNTETKISSQSEHQVLFLEKNPKIISLVKTWQPSIRLIGFKLLVDVLKAELLEVARASLMKNQAELIVANDLTEIGTDRHRAYLVHAEGVEQVETKVDIAQALVQHIHQGG